MRRQVAAANWKMNGTYQQAEKLLGDILDSNIELQPHQQVVFAVPFPFLIRTSEILGNRKNYAIAAQNCYQKPSGAYTGEVSAEMLASIGIKYCVIGHSERREYFGETNRQLAEKTDILLKNNIIPIFCCGEPLDIREAGKQDEHVATQIRESLFHLSAEALEGIIIAYEPIWAIGTGKTATTQQAQDMHAYLRKVLAQQYGTDTANKVPVLYGGSVKANNAAELFASTDVDGGLVGGASLVANDFIAIIKALK
jgi:triosephosphate isomerase (TIM)